MSWVEVLGFVVIARFLTGGLDADAGLQVVYIGLGLAGGWAWQRGTALAVRQHPCWGWAVAPVATSVGTWAVPELLSHRTDSTVPLGVVGFRARHQASASPLASQRDDRAVVTR